MGAYTSFNGSGDQNLAWNWKANGSGSTNTDGNMPGTVTVSANPTAGFSIVTYSGTGTAGTKTIGHGLSAAPELVIVKDRASNAWIVGSEKGMDFTDYMILNTSAAAVDDDAMFADTAPTASVFSVSTAVQVNADSDYVAYCFHSVEGYSKVNSYVGNGSADGTFVYTGFRPAFLFLKSTGDTGKWNMLDNKRNTYNVVKSTLRADLATAQNNSYNIVDFVSNGFKFRDVSWGEQNNNAITYVYVAYAETPFKTANAR